MHTPQVTATTATHPATSTSAANQNSVLRLQCSKSILTPAYPFNLLIHLISIEIIDSELFDLPTTAEFLRLGISHLKDERIAVCRNLHLDSRIVSKDRLAALNVHHHQLPIGQHHGKIDSQETVISQPQLDSFKPLPGYFPVALAQLKVLAVSRLGFVHLSGLKSPERLQ